MARPRRKCRSWPATAAAPRPFSGKRRMASVKAPRAPLYGAILFTPADRPDRFDKGWAASGGALILDLEDGVAPPCKAVARESIAGWIAPGRDALVRVNAVDTAAFADDVASLTSTNLPAIVIPKTQSAADVAAVARAWPGAALFPLIE